MSAPEDDISPTWILHPFDRPLALNLLAVGGIVAVWLATFLVGIQYFGTESLAVAESTAGQILRFRAGAVGAVLLGGYVAVITVAGVGWPIWNIGFGLFVPVFVGSGWFYLIGRPVPSGFYTIEGYLYTAGGALRVITIGGSYIVSLMLVTYVLARLYFRTDERKIAWLERLPK